MAFINCYRAYLTMNFINKNKIITATIVEPYQRDESDKFDASESHGWIVSFHVGYRDGYPDVIKVDKDIKEDCLNLIKDMGLYAL